MIDSRGQIVVPANEVSEVQDQECFPRGGRQERGTKLGLAKGTHALTEGQGEPETYLASHSRRISHRIH